MPKGDKDKYTGKQERKAGHIAESYEAKGVPEHEAERRAWATVNKDDGGGKAGGSGVAAEPDIRPEHKGGEASAARPKRAKSDAAKKAVSTRRRKATA